MKRSMIGDDRKAAAAASSVSGTSTDYYYYNTNNNISASGELPIEILDEIFYRLPIQSLMICKCVCTAWRNLISHPSFSQFYSRNSNYTPLLHMVCKPNDVLPKGLGLLDIPDCSRKPMDLKLPASFHQKKLRDYYHVQSCGLLCWVGCFSDGSDDFISVRNPILGSDDEYSVTVLASASDDDGMSQFCLFDFSPSTNIAKLLRIYSHVGKHVGKCEIVTIGVDRSWRVVPLDCFEDFRPTGGYDEYCFNGMLHWIPSVGGGNYISTFDIAHEKAGSHIPLPPGFVLDNKGFHHTLHIFRDQLSVVDYSDKSQLTIWMMSRYAVPESWSKTLVLKSSIRNLTYPTLFGVQEGWVLVFDYCNYHLISGNMENKSTLVYDLRKDPKFYLIPYAPNFCHRADKL